MTISSEFAGFSRGPDAYTAEPFSAKTTLYAASASGGIGNGEPPLRSRPIDGNWVPAPSNAKTSTSPSAAVTWYRREKGP